MRIHKEGVCGVSNIGEHLGVTNAAASQMINKLVENGLLARSEDPNDRRNRLIALTPAGEALVHDFFHARYAWLQGLSDQLSLERQETIIKAIHNLNEAAERLEPVDTEFPLSSNP
jgi:DNA-binding MarR family transcriptional regulator